MAKETSFLLAGDAFQARCIYPYREQDDVKALFDKIQSADVAFMNLEIAIHSFEGHPIGEGKYDAYGQADPPVAQDIKNMGFNIVSRANNHAMDYTEGGMKATTKYLDEAELVYAGAGLNLGEAREPAFLETSKGIVALVSATTWELGLAGHGRKEVKGRPGVNPLRMIPIYHLSASDMNKLETIAENLGVLPADNKEGFNFPIRGQKFIPDTKTYKELVPHPVDLEENLKAVQDAKQLGNWVFFALHDHYTGLKAPEGYRNLELPPESVINFAHQVIDAGADIYMGHGPHILRGIELYKGKPIFYSLGNFVFQSTLCRRQPADLFELWGLGSEETTVDLYMKREAPPSTFFKDMAYWESIVAELDYEDKVLKEIRLIPIHLDMDPDKPLAEQRTTAGVPHMAYGETAERIIKNMTRLCKYYGTKVIFRDGVGVIIL